MATDDRSSKLGSDLPGVAITQIDCGEVALECAVAGPESAPLVVLLHGFPECWYSWRHQITALASAHRVVAPNLRGYGRSGRPAGVAAYRLDRLVGDIVGLVAALKRPTARVVGHDWGGAIAWAMAIDHPSLVEKLVVCNCPHPAKFAKAIRSDPGQMARSWYFLLFLLPNLPEELLLFGDFAVLRALYRISLPGKSFDEVFDTAYLEHLHKALGRIEALTAAVNYYRAAVLHSDELRRYVKAPPISAPTRLFWGDDDPALGSELATKMERLFTGDFKLETLPGCGHWVQQEEPETVNKLLVEFLGN